MPVTAQPAPGARTASRWPVLAGALLAPVCAWALMRLLGPGLDPELRPIAAALAGLWAASLFLLPGALGSGLALTAMAPASPQNMKAAGAMTVPSPRPLPLGEGEVERAPGATFTVNPLGTAAALALTAGVGAAVATLATGVQPQVAVLVLVGLMALVLAALGDGLKALTGGPGTAAAWALTLVVIIGAAPVWLLPLHGSIDPGPVGLDTLVAVNPLTHVAILTGTDWPRSDWCYRHSALGSLRYVYPSPSAVVTWYLLAPIAWLGVRRTKRTARRQGTQTVPVPIPLSPTPN